MGTVERKFCDLTLIYYSKGFNLEEAMKKASNLIVKESRSR